MAIVPSLPNTLQNGQPADANQVMANFNTIRDGVNQNGAHNGDNSDITSMSGLTIPLSTVQGGTGAKSLAGAGIVTGPVSATAGNIATFSGTSGKIIGDSGVPPTVLMPTGAVLPYAGSTAPVGWEMCDGGPLSRTTNAALFAVIGTAYGAGDGSTTFNKPDLRGSLPMGLDNMGGTAANRVTAAISGVNSTTLGGRGGDQSSQAHSHGVNDPGHFHTVQGQSANTSGGPTLFFGNSTPAGRFANSDTKTTGISIQSAGAGGSQNMPPVLALNYIIKT